MDDKIESILERARCRFEPQPEELEFFRSDIEGSLKTGWSDSDILSFMGNTEEMNPELSEDLALTRMAIINARNKTNFGGHKK